MGFRRAHVEILDFIDDHARFALSVTAHRRIGAGPRWATFWGSLVWWQGVCGLADPAAQRKATQRTAELG
jgi:hypothetical protein